MALTEQQINDRIEIILDRIAEAIIQNTPISPTVVTQNQKTIRNGIISVGRNNSERMILFQQDIKANEEDLQSTNGTDTLRSIVEQIEDINQAEIIVEGVNVFISYKIDGENITTIDLTPLLTQVSTNEDGTQTILNPLNVSQFINIQQKSTSVDAEQANEFLDTNIYELLPDGSDRQEQIDDLFIQIDELLPPPIQDEEWGLDDNGRVNRNSETSEWEGSQDYYLNNSISSAQNDEVNSIEEEDGFITRLEKNTSDKNSLKSIESLRNRLSEYLLDVDEQEVELQDDRLEYQNQSDGYLKFRNLNQGIIIRNTNQDFIDGLNPNTQEYLQTGFTITMWVRFLDKTSTGTLFNFGNPTRAENPFGFKLETYVINGDDFPTQINGNYLSGFGSGTGQDTIGEELTWKQIFQNDGYTGLGYDNNTRPNENFFQDTDTERFIRLVVRDDKLRGSHIGMPFFRQRDGLPEFGYYDNQGEYDHAYGLMSNLKIPSDFNEWYFICATYNPFINEDESHSPEIYNQYQFNSNFWRNNINPNGGSPIVNSNYGQKCKVEIISRSDLLRARGFKG